MTANFHFHFILTAMCLKVYIPQLRWEILTRNNASRNCLVYNKVAISQAIERRSFDQDIYRVAWQKNIYFTPCKKRTQTRGAIAKLSSQNSKLQHARVFFTFSSSSTAQIEAPHALSLDFPCSLAGQRRRESARNGESAASERVRTDKSDRALLGSRALSLSPGANQRLQGIIV